MNDFIHQDFLLATATARRLYHEFAEGLPIIDYHCHLDPADLAADRAFENITQLWIAPDPYKHRAMRIAGVPERCITGSASDREKFEAWAATVPLTLGNPLFHWTALELKRYFGIGEILSPATAGRAWDACNACLRDSCFTARQLVARAGAECVCTSDRLLDDLQPHAALARSSVAFRVLPSLRADEILAVESPGYTAWLQQLGRASGIAVDSFATFQQAVSLRLDDFAERGARLADQALDDFRYQAVPEDEAAALFARRLAGEALAPAGETSLKSAILRFLGLAYGRRNWIMQWHLGAQRHTSSRLRRLAGPAGGYTTIGNACDIPSLCRLLDDLEREEALPRTILYPLNPADNAALAVLTGSFAEDGVRGKIQLGPAWWYNDHAAGIRNQLEVLASHGLLAAFIGMTTDARCLFSMVRHEYFRRILCDWLGGLAEAGHLPADDGWIGGHIQAIACGNARQWLCP